MASVTGVVRVPSSNGIIGCGNASGTVGTGRGWFFLAFCRTLGMGGVLGNEWRSLAGFTF